MGKWGKEKNTPHYWVNLGWFTGPSGTDLGEKIK